VRELAEVPAHRVAVSGLAGLGAVEPVADLTALGLTLGLELADDLPRQGRFGTGVLVAPLGSAIGLDADVVFVVVGLAPGHLAPLRDRLDRQHRQLLAVLAAGWTVFHWLCEAALMHSASRRTS